MAHTGYRDQRLRAGTAVATGAMRAAGVGSEDASAAAVATRAPVTPPTRGGNGFAGTATHARSAECTAGRGARGALRWHGRHGAGGDAAGAPRRPGHRPRHGGRDGCAGRARAVGVAGGEPVAVAPPQRVRGGGASRQAHPVGAPTRPAPAKGGGRRRSPQPRGRTAVAGVPAGTRGWSADRQAPSPVVAALPSPYVAGGSHRHAARRETEERAPAGTCFALGSTHRAGQGHPKEKGKKPSGNK